MYMYKNVRESIAHMQFGIFRYYVETRGKVECFQETGVQSRGSAEMDESLSASNDVQ